MKKLKIIISAILVLFVMPIFSDINDIQTEKITIQGKEKNAYAPTDGNGTNLPSSYFLSKEGVIKDGNENHHFDQYGGITIQVETQLSFPICYAFAAFKSYETNISLKYPEKRDNPENFSELHSKFLMSKGYSRDVFNGDYIKKVIGPVDESVLDIDEASNWRADEDERKRTIYAYCTEDKNTSLTQTQINQAYDIIPNVTPEYYIIKTTKLPRITGEDKNDESKAEEVTLKRNEIKNHIMKNGSVSTTIASPASSTVIGEHKDKNGNCISYTFYLKNEESRTERTHEVSLVGWDDNFSKDNFDWLPEEERPQKNGAYLALNSWGDYWGPQNGYFWISYEDCLVEYNTDGASYITKDRVQLTNDNVSAYSVNDEQYEYKNEVIKPSIKCTINNENFQGDVELIENVDYEVLMKTDTPDPNYKDQSFYDSNYDYINPGKKVIRIRGINRFQGEAELEYEIVPRNLENCSVMYMPLNYTYSGKKVAINNRIAINVGTYFLNENTDYICYPRDKNYDNWTNAGEEIELICEGIGKFTGTIKREFEINPKALNVKADNVQKKYNSTDPELTFTVTGAVEGEVPKFAGKLKRELGEDAGEYEIQQGDLKLIDNKNTGFKANNYYIYFEPGTFTINNIVVSSISIKTQPKTSYFVGDTLDLTGMVLLVKYNNGDEEEITSGYTANVQKLDTAGKQEVIITYNGKTTKLEVTVNEIELTGIAVTQAPSKVSYIEGQNFDSTGMEVTATYNYGSSNKVTNYTITDGNNLTAGKTSVTISYTEDGVTKTATQGITVIAKELNSIEITKLPSKTEYFVGEKLDLTGMELKATYNNGDEEEVTEGYTADIEKLNTVGTQEITITYNGKTTKIEVTVKEKQQPGDVSGNKEIDPNDYIAILRHIAAQSDPTKAKWILSEEKQAIADVTKDGKIDLNDVIKIKRYIAAKNDPNVANAHPNWLNI